MQLSVKAKALKLINTSERKSYRKQRTKEVIGMEDFESELGNESPFKAHGSLEDSIYRTSE